MEGKVALVTGGSSGIGRAVADLFTEHGAAVVILDRDASPGDLAVRGDVCDPEAHRRAVDQAVSRCGRLDVLVANAGIHDGGAQMQDLTPEHLVDLTRKVVDVNLLGVLLGVQAAEPALRASAGSVIITLSDAAFTAADNGAGPVYAASKAALRGVVMALGTSLAPQVRVNGVAPGGVLTDLQAVTVGGGLQSVFDDPEDARSEVASMNPLGVMLTPEQLAESYLYLASSWSTGMTGQVLRPDGGLALR